MQMPTYGQYPYQAPYLGYQQSPYGNMYPSFWEGQQQYSIPQKTIKAKAQQKTAPHLNPHASLFFSGPIPEIDRIFFG